MSEQHQVGAEAMSPDRRLEARRQLFASYGVEFPMPTQRKPARRLAFRDLHAARLAAGLTAAGLVASLIELDMLWTAPHPHMIWPTLACIGSSEVPWLVLGTITLLAIWRLRGFIRCAECLLLGAGLAFLQLPVGVQVARLLAPFAAIFRRTPGHIHDWSPVDLSLGTYLWAGALFAPPGAFGGWVLWKTLCSHSEDESDRITPLTRHASPISSRLMLSLAIAPLIPALALAVFLGLLFGSQRAVPLFLAWSTGYGELLSLVGGSSLILLIAARQPIRRADCLWIGMGISLLLPLAVHYAGMALSRFGGNIEANISGGYGEVAEVACDFFIGYFVMLAGLPGGWLVWRLAFKNRQPAPARLSAIFE